MNHAGVPFMISGSLASSVYGQPRATNDLDIVIDPDESALERFLAGVPSEWYVSPEAARSALQARSMFNIIDTSSGWKADLLIRKNRPFSMEEFNRRVRSHVLGVDAALVTPEDSILSKLEWFAETGSDRQFQDALAVARLAGANLDFPYLRRWAGSLGVTEPLERLLQSE
jgi:hypothetical protein